MFDPADHLLPAPSPLSRALSVVDAERINLYPADVLLTLLDPQTCPAQFLPALAFELSVEEEWDLARTEQQQRDLLSNAYALNAKKGTPFAIKRGLAVIGFPGVTLVEGFPTLDHDGFIAKRNGRHNYNSRARWALFDVRIPLTGAQAFDDGERARVLRGIEIWQRAACYLRALHLATTLTVTRETDAVAALRLHVGLRLQARRDTPRDGRFRRVSLHRHRYDGVIDHDGVAVRDGAILPLPADVLRFGVQQVNPRLGVHLHLKQERPPSILFDAAILRDGSLARNYNGALIRKRRQTGFGDLVAVADRSSLRDGAIAFDGSVRRGAGVPSACLILRTHTLLRHDGTRRRGGHSFDGTATRNGALRRDTALRFTATGRLTASVP